MAVLFCTKPGRSSRVGASTTITRLQQAAGDYIVVDEFHHAAAGTYRRLIDYFQPKFLLGLTATPERTDASHRSEDCALAHAFSR